jgi:hypothetical protein
MSSIFIDVAIAVTAANCVDVIATDVNYFATNTLLLGDCCDFEGSNYVEANQCGKHMPRAE